MAQEDDEKRVRARFEEVFGDTRLEYLQALLGDLPARGIGNILADIEEGRNGSGKSKSEVSQENAGVYYTVTENSFNR